MHPSSMNMNAIRSHIFMMSSGTWRAGVCWLCDEPVLLKYRDVTTGMTFGTCCVESVLFADRMLLTARKDGVRSPSENEVDTIPNH